MKFCGARPALEQQCVVVVSDAEDRIVLQRRLPNELGANPRGAGGSPRRSCGRGCGIDPQLVPALVDGLMDAGYRVHLAHVAGDQALRRTGTQRGCRRCRPSRRQSLRLGLLLEGYIDPQRATGRTRSGAQADPARAMLYGPGGIDRETSLPGSHRCACGLAAPRSSMNDCRSGERARVATPGRRAGTQGQSRDLRNTAAADCVILEKRLAECVKLRADYRLLKTVPGIGETLWRR